MTTEFLQERTALVAGSPEFGQVALLPWDIRIFGFPVGEYFLPSSPVTRTAMPKLRDAFNAWVEGNDIRLCAVSIPTSRRDWMAAVPQLGFSFVDFTLRASLRLSLTEPRVQALRIRLATPTDLSVLRSIAARAFDAGRYHSDAAFPRSLANLRYEHWIENALAESNTLYAAEGDGGPVTGFFQIRIANGTADLRLAAIDPAMRGTGIGFELYAAMLAHAKAAGARRATAIISAANTGVLNIYTALGFRFFEGSAVFHWHPKQQERAAEDENDELRH